MSNRTAGMVISRSKRTRWKIALVTLWLMAANLSCIMVALAWGQKTAGAIQGIVLDARTHQPIKQVLVQLNPGAFVTFTRNNGAFWLSHLPPDEYEIQFIKPGYLNAIYLRQKIRVGEIHTLQVELVPSQGMTGDVIQIGGIQILANKELLPEHLETTTLIHSSDLEHIQATSLADALDLVPGMELRNQPHLKSPRTAQLRDPRPANVMSAFGTKIIIDGVPYSNNSNLQGPLLSGVYTGMGNGVDLREIPADHIEAIEVIRGIAPVEHGDFAGGAIKVTTRSSLAPRQRIKAKNNPDTKEINWEGNLILGKSIANYNLNWAYSQRDLRKDYDNTQRISGQIKLVRQSPENHRFNQQLISYSKLIEAVRVNPIDPDAMESIDRGFRFAYGNRFSSRISSGQRFSSNLFINYRRHDSYKQYRIVADNQVASPLMSPGTAIGVKVPYTYLFQCTTLGDELSLGHDVQWRLETFAGKWFHAIKFGHQFQFDENFGQGRKFDVLKPDYIGHRPRKFDAIPGLFQQAFYLNDQLTGRLGKEFTLDLGLRLERYTSDHWPHIHFFKSKHGIFLNPRINFAYYFTSKTQVRLGYGQFTKAPGLSYCFPDPTYFDVLDIATRVIGNDTLFIRDSLITTYVFDGANRNLKGIRERKLELSWDQQLGGIGFSFTGFCSKRDGEFHAETVPVIYHKYLRLGVGEISGQAVIDTLMNHYLTNINAGWSRFDGVDLVIKSQRHPKLNLDGTIMISFHRAKSGVTVLDWGIPFPDFTIPKYPSSVFQVQKALITYQFNYISRALGIWMSLLAQQMPYYRTRRFGYADSLAIAYYHGPSNQTILIPESERGNVAYQRYRLSKNPRAYQAHRYPSKWLINFRISKSLFHGAELSFYVNNLFNNRAYYRDPDNPERYYAGNPEIFYGIEFSMVIDRLFHRRPK